MIEKAKIPVLESGKVAISTGDISVVNINLAPKRVDVDFEDKDFLKRIIKIGREFQGFGGDQEEGEQALATKKESRGAIASVRMVAEALENWGFTVGILYKGKEVVVLGSEASPTLLQLVTKTKFIAVKNFFSLIRMIV